SEQSDAVVLVVSEETGVISIAVEGQLERDFTRDKLIKRLNELLLDEFEEEESKYRKLRKGRKKQ
ncbi:MAG: DNA integrity scanning protein DisA nucleotide-binding domain protein, partial [Ruminococcus sp.]|nr:DNA integrity scanning protein DisA nucleotide-binding domain protein [Ruminococcus sp.]